MSDLFKNCVPYMAKWLALGNPFTVEGELYSKFIKCGIDEVPVIEDGHPVIIIRKVTKNDQSKTLTFEERVKNLHALSQEYDKLSIIVHSMETNEDAPVYDSTWEKVLKDRFNQSNEVVQSLVKELGL